MRRAFYISIAILLLALIVVVPPNSSKLASYAQSSNSNPSDAESLPPLQSETTDGTFMVQLNWEPKSPLGIDRNTTLIVSFLNKSGQPVKQVVNYDLVVAGFDLSPIGEFYNETTDQSGVGMPHVVRFQNASAIEVTVWVNQPNSAPSSATFDLTVTPEFPVSSIVFATSLAAVLLIMIFKSRLLVRIAKTHKGP